MTIKPRERGAILQSLAAGVVPRLGLHHIQVGRKLELEAMLTDMARIEEGGASIRFVIGRFGCGKSFFLNLVRMVALERRFVSMQADITIERRLQGPGAATALYTELINNVATRAKPEGGAMPGLVERFVSDVATEAGTTADAAAIEALVKKKLQALVDLTHGSSFIRVLSRYVEGFARHDDRLVNAATRWLRGEYGTRTEAKTDLGVRDIIEDGNLYDMLKLWGRFLRLAGYAGLLVGLDEMVVLAERLNNTPARTKNYEVILQILNDCLQGSVAGIGFVFAGTEEFLSDRRRGLFSYEALATRLAENPFAGKGVIDTCGPILRLPPLTKEDLFVLLERISLVHADGDASKRIVDQDGLTRFLAYCDRRLGAEHFLSPREAAKEFVGLLNVLDQNPDKKLDDLLTTPKMGPESGRAMPTIPPKADSEGDPLARFQL